MRPASGGGGRSPRCGACAYHTRKAESLDFVETVQGTFGTAGAADTIVVVKRAPR